MKLFVSYARSDAGFVGRLVARLEEVGHDVWVDTDDLVGSDQWRASIVDGVRTSDAVLLVVSPHSMSSEYVEREVVVAAEQQRRIFPIVAEPAPLSGSILFELAGTQQHSFVARPFDDAMRELLRALAVLGEERPAPNPAPSAAPTSAPNPAPSRAPTGAPTRVSDLGVPDPTDSRSIGPGRPGRSRPGWARWAGIAAVAALVAALAIVVQQFRGTDAATAPRGSTPSSPGSGATTGQVQPSTGQVQPSTGQVQPSTGPVLGLTGEVWFAGFRFAAQQLTRAETGDRVVIRLRSTNDQFTTADPAAAMGDSVALEWSDSRAPALCSCSTRVPPGASSATELDFYVPRDLDLRTATLVFGGPTGHQARLSLNGLPASFEQPVTKPATGTVDDGAGTRFTAEQVRVVPARCDGLANSLLFARAARDQFAVVVVGSALYRGKYPVNLGQAVLRIPDGTTVASSSLAGPIYALSDNRPQHDIAICFDVPGPVTGSYRLAVTSTGVNPASVTPISVDL